jgi:hypothetical protein
MKTDSRLLTAYGPNFLQSFRMHITYLPNVRFTVKHIYAVYSAQTYSISMYPHDSSPHANSLVRMTTASLSAVAPIFLQRFRTHMYDLQNVRYGCKIFPHSFIPLFLVVLIPCIPSFLVVPWQRQHVPTRLTILREPREALLQIGAYATLNRYRHYSASPAGTYKSRPASN